MDLKKERISSLGTMMSVELYRLDECLALFFELYLDDFACYNSKYRVLLNF